MTENTNTAIQTITSDTIKDRIYTIGGVQVMLDSDLAQIYGYETKNFNRQVKNNIEKFPEDMMFQFTKEETSGLSRCKNFTLDKQYGKNNIEKFPEDMMFQLTKEDLDLLRSKFLTANISAMSRSLICTHTG